MRHTWLVIAICVLAAGAWGAARAEDTKPDPGDATRPPRDAEFVDGRVKEIDLKVAKIAVEVEVEADKPAEVMIFALTVDTKVRKAEKAFSVADIRKGNQVRVWYTPSDKKGESGKAVFIRLFDDGDRGFGRGGRGRGRGR